MKELLACPKYLDSLDGSGLNTEFYSEMYERK